ncbi:cytochrome c oxidase subunit II [Isoalcanivorax indicus]|uniref:cytochrome c oxidase subunit II n=1 Tax=Isoalcanivorax indicus TaxID=2202653 RepID=UPI001B866D8B|nr:cytochrome c oxidase subunit II [Isoalcanivorax indicus]
MTPSASRQARLPCLLVLAGSLTACGGDQSALAPAGSAARDVALLWWWMLGVSAVVLLAVCGLWLWAQFRTPPPTDQDTEQRIARRWLIGGGLALPLVAITVLLAFGIPIGHRMLPLPLTEAPMKIEVTGHQWWWEVHYPDTGITLEDHIIMPAGRPVDFHLESADVIHSFWVPRLGGKIDMIPGRTNVLRLQADAPGRFRGQCAEFCGLRHAHMVLTVEALAEDDWQAWLADQQEAGE